MSEPNLLSAEVAIIERLRDQVPDITVGSVASIAGALDITKLCPFIFVQPGGSDVPDFKGNGRVSLEEQLWVVTLMVAAVPDQNSFEASYQEAGVGLGKIYRALAGWSIGAGHAPFEYHGRPDPHLDLGWGAFPISFRCRVVLS